MYTCYLSVQTDNFVSSRDTNSVHMGNPLTLKQSSGNEVEQCQTS